MSSRMWLPPDMNAVAMRTLRYWSKRYHRVQHLFEGPRGGMASLPLTNSKHCGLRLCRFSSPKVPIGRHCMRHCLYLQLSMIALTCRPKRHCRQYSTIVALSSLSYKPVIRSIKQHLSLSFLFSTIYFVCNCTYRNAPQGHSPTVA